MPDRPLRSAPLLLAATLAAFPGAPDLVDPASRTRFPAERSIPGRKGPPLRAVGLCLRSAFDIPEYCFALYVDLPALRAKAGPQRDPAALAELLRSGEVPLGFPRRFLRGVGREFRTKALRESLQRYWPNGAFSPDSPSVKACLTCVDRDIQRGDWVDFWCDGRGGLVLCTNEGPPTRIQDPALCRAFLTNYLAPESPRERDELMRHVLRNLPALLDESLRSR